MESPERLGLVRNAAFEARNAYQVVLRYGLGGRKGRARLEPYIGAESGEGSKHAVQLRGALRW